MRFGDLRSDAAFLTEQAAQMHEDLEGIGAYALRRLNPSAHTSAEELSETAERMQRKLQKSEKLLGMLEKHQADISELCSETEQGIIKLKSDKMKLTAPEEIREIEEQLSRLQEQKEKLDRMQQSAGEMTEQFRDRVNRTGEILRDVQSEHYNRIATAQRRKDIAKGIVAAPAKVAASAFKRTAKDAVRRANPLDRQINKGDTADHGMESLRLAYRTGKKTVQTAKSTAKSTAKTAKSTVKAVKKAPRVVVNTAKQTVNVVRKTVRVTAAVLTHVVAALINPVTWILLFFGMVIFVILSIVVIIMGGASTQDATQAISYTQQVGIDDTDMDESREFYRLACERNKGNFSGLINGL